MYCTCVFLLVFFGVGGGVFFGVGGGVFLLVFFGVGGGVFFGVGGGVFLLVFFGVVFTTKIYYPTLVISINTLYIYKNRYKITPR